MPSNAQQCLAMLSSLAWFTMVIDRWQAHLRGLEHFLRGFAGPVFAEERQR